MELLGVVTLDSTIVFGDYITAFTTKFWAEYGALLTFAFSALAVTVLWRRSKTMAKSA